jgi:hypothetical protein
MEDLGSLPKLRGNGSSWAGGRMHNSTLSRMHSTVCSPDAAYDLQASNCCCSCVWECKASLIIQWMWRWARVCCANSTEVDSRRCWWQPLFWQWDLHASQGSGLRCCCDAVSMWHVWVLRQTMNVNIDDECGWR